MRPSFVPRLVNGPLFDPMVYVRIMNENRAIMFDCGRFGRMAERELLAVETICISHAHMNHFMGFDEVLRSILHRKEPLGVYGPEGITERVLSKLQAYTWNLSAGYELEIRIHEILPDQVIVTRSAAQSGFTHCQEGVFPRDGKTIAVTDRYCLESVIFDHGGIPCLGYVLREPFHINIRKGVLGGKGYVAGPWLAQLKRCLLTSNPDEMIGVATSSGMKQISAGDLSKELVIITEGQSMTFITDIACSERNLTAIDEMAGKTDLLFIEAFYLNELHSQAIEKGHLTAVQAGMIARKLKAGHVVPMHVSPRYHDRLPEIYREMQVPDYTS